MDIRLIIPANLRNDNDEMQCMIPLQPCSLLANLKIQRLYQKNRHGFKWPKSIRSRPDYALDKKCAEFYMQGITAPGGKPERNCFSGLARRDS